jgi:hypothetical protein
MKKFEYLFIGRLLYTSEASEIQTMLNEFGEQGWELAHMDETRMPLSDDHRVEFWLKREKQFTDTQGMHANI